MNRQVITKDTPMTPELERFIKGEVIIEEGPMPPELARQFEQARRNLLWFNGNVERLEVYKRHRGRFVVAVGGELLVADTPAEIDRLVEEKYPDESAHVRYIQREKRFRIYGSLRQPFGLEMPARAHSTVPLPFCCMPISPGVV